MTAAPKGCVSNSVSRLPQRPFPVRLPAGTADFSEETASELRALKDSNTVRVLDLVLLSEVG